MEVAKQDEAETFQMKSIPKRNLKTCSLPKPAGYSKGSVIVITDYIKKLEMQQLK